jgi:hypothetical protein
MKKIYVVLLLSVTCIASVYAQNNTGIIYNSPPLPRQTKGNIGSGNSTDNLKVDTAKGGIKFINGSFELNTGLCIINGSNEYINNNVLGVTAYGCANEIDLMNNTCGYGTAISGKYFLCLSNGDGTCTDAVNLKLNRKLVQGQTYTICYFDRGYDVNGCCPPGSPLEIGISTAPNSQGTVVYTSPVPKTNVWSHRFFTFVAPDSGKYVSFKPNGTGRWTHIDSIRILKGNISTAIDYAITDKIVSNPKMSVSGFSAILNPNPAASLAILKITNATGTVQVWLTDIQGKTLWQSPRSSQNIIRIDVSRLEHGTFMVLIKDQKEMKALKLIKQ